MELLQKFIIEDDDHKQVHQRDALINYLQGRIDAIDEFHDLHIDDVRRGVEEMSKTLRWLSAHPGSESDLL